MTSKAPASRASIDRFLAQRRLALIGASRSGRKFGNTLLRELRAKGYDVHPIHPSAPEIDGVRCAKAIADLDPAPGGVVVCVPPEGALELVDEVAHVGVRHLWLQQGSESDRAIARCRELEIDTVHGECLLMFAEPAGFVHRAHRFINGVFGKLPE